MSLPLVSASINKVYNSERRNDKRLIKMKAIVNKTDWPQFLKVNDVMERVSLNKYLLKPWKKGEIVKVVPYDEQKSSCSTPTEVFRKRYVNVIRKDEEGQWTLRYNWSWDIFEPLNSHKS